MSASPPILDEKTSAPPVVVNGALDLEIGNTEVSELPELCLQLYANDERCSVYTKVTLRFLDNPKGIGDEAVSAYVEKMRFGVASRENMRSALVEA